MKTWVYGQDKENQPKQSPREMAKRIIKSGPKESMIDLPEESIKEERLYDDKHKYE